MQIIPTQLRSLRCLSGLTLAALLVVLCNCGGSQVTVSSEHCGGVACTGTAQCQSNVPLCADPLSATCLNTSPRECTWKAKINASCPCMEHNVRLCTASGGVPGVQICTANAARTYTYWAACVPCPNCTP